MNVEKMREELTKVWEGLKSGEISAKDASEFSNIAGKMINSSKVQMEYFHLRGDERKIAFLEGGVKDENAPS